MIELHQGDTIDQAASRSRLDEGALLDTARQLADAERHGDARALEDLIAADYVGFDPSGRHQDRAGILRAYAERRVVVTTLGQTDLRARVVGEVGLVTGVSEYQGRQSDEHFDFRLRFLDVYARRDGRWQLIASQDTRLPR
ncbi:MAG TPA: nuclear transport factor 2 family protein [Gemmatimonadales bacterium]|nr:nuclear transport factor 2 family protein [Gemmatimonadales bacterium]